MRWCDYCGAATDWAVDRAGKWYLINADGHPHRETCKKDASYMAKARAIMNPVKVKQETLFE